MATDNSIKQSKVLNYSLYSTLGNNITCVLLDDLFQTVISYNIGGYESIGNGVIEEPPSRADRRDAIINQLKYSDADVICLQEVIIVWYPTVTDCTLTNTLTETVYPSLVPNHNFL